jgi:3-hydroxy-3-methylglutaryl CoA synthase
MQNEEKTVKLQNVYNGTIVYTKDFDDIYRMNEMEFIRVYEEANSQRTYLANRAAFKKLDK